MKKFLVLTILILSSILNASAEEAIEGYITKTQEYYRGQIDIVQKYSTTNFMRAITAGDTNLVEMYLKAGMNPNSTQAKLPAIIVAIGSKQPAALSLLIKHGADIETGAMGVSPLMFAINRKNPECAKILIENKANVNNGYKDISPLYMAIAKKQFETAKLLLSAGAIADDATIIKAIKAKNEEIKTLVVNAAAAQNKP